MDDNQSDQDVEFEKDADDGVQNEESEESEGEFVPPSQRDNAPLAGIINPELEDIDPRLYFPEFAPNKTLRFSRLFSRCSKPSQQAIYYLSKSFDRNAGAKNERIADIVENQKAVTFKPNFLPPFPREELNDPSLNAYNDDKDDGAQSDDDATPPPWRYGPSQIWYDHMGLPPKPRKFDYGVRKYQVKQKTLLKNMQPLPLESNSNEEETPYVDSPLDDSAFLPVNIERWEDNIIYDIDEARETFCKDYSDGRIPYGGFIPVRNARTQHSFIKLWKKLTPRDWLKGEIKDPASETEKSMIDSSHSIFPLDNFDLDSGDWENDIIWDVNEIKAPLEPKMLTLEFEDDPKIFGIPDDIPLDDPDNDDNSKVFDRRDHQFTKKSKLILGQVQQRQKQEEQEQMESTMAQITDRDPFNLSNDDYYAPKAVARQNVVFSGGTTIQHSLPAQHIHRAFFPTCMPPYRLRHFHRLPIQKRFLRVIGGSNFTYVPITSLQKYRADLDTNRERRKISEVGFSEVFPVREISDLSAKDGDLVLLEYSEEHPPLLSQPGMACKIRNYFKRVNNTDAEPELDYGEMSYSHAFPFLGVLESGHFLQAVENNMYRAPIYRHEPKTQDYLLIKSASHLVIRKCPQLFAVGQECPLQEVPNPNSKKASNFVRDFLLAFIYRLFWASNDNPRRLRMDDIKAAFPHYAESSVRKRLKGCSDFKRLGAGTEQNYWVLREDFRLPSKEEVFAMITPEMCCANYSMLAAEQRLKDAGYGEKYIFAGDEENDSDDEVTIEDEIKCAPWNTTRAFLAAQRGKCVLDQTGIADPTGCGFGYSYVRVSAKPQKEDIPQVPKRLVTGTNADLRKLPLKEAKEICKEYGVRDEEINALSRWEIIDVIRTLSTQAAKARSDFSGMARFARGNIRFNYADMQQKYKEYCQRIFELQNHTLSNSGELSTDNESSGVEEEDYADLQIENLLGNVENSATKASSKKTKKSKKSLETNSEQKDLEDIMRMVHGDENSQSQSSTTMGASVSEKSSAPQLGSSVFGLNPQSNPLLNLPPGQDEITVCNNLKISRKDMETLLNREIKKKLRIVRWHKDSDGRDIGRSEVISNPQVIEAYVRIRSTKDEKFVRDYAHKDEGYKEEKRKEKRRLQDQLRRIKRNEEKHKMGLVPKKQAAPPKLKPVKESLQKMRCSACGGNGHMKTNKNCPLYGRDSGPSNIKTVGDIIGVHRDDSDRASVAKMVELDGTKMTIRKPKDLMKLKIPKGVLKPSVDLSMSSDVLSTAESTDDGSGSEDRKPSTSKLSFKPGKVSSGRKRTLQSTDSADYLIGPHKSVHRRRADPRVIMSSRLSEIYAELKAVEGAENLLTPVNKKKVPDYDNIIKTPMDLQSIHKKITSNVYELRKDFLVDVRQMLTNSTLYNGDNHPITKTAQTMFQITSQRFSENEGLFLELEMAINPLLNADDMVGFCHILNEFLESAKSIPKSAAFHNKVDARKLPLYHDKIKQPMHFAMIQQNIKDKHYFTVGQFRRHIEQIRINSEIYNGPQSSYTLKAVEICDHIDKRILQRAPQLAELEANIRKRMEAEGLPIIDDEEFSLSSIMQQFQNQTFSESPFWTEGDTHSLGDDSDRPMTASVLLGDDDETRAGFDDDSATGVLNDDLALSDDDDDVIPSQRFPDSEYTTEDDDASRDNISFLTRSNMNAAGQLSNDLALSSSSESEDEMSAAKRPRMDDDLDNF